MTEASGILRQQAHITRQQAQGNAIINAKRIIIGKTHSVSQQHRAHLVSVFLQTQAGTLLQASHKLGTAQAGNRQQQELTTKQQAQRSAISAAI